MRKAAGVAASLVAAILAGYLGMRATTSNVRVGVHEADALFTAELAPGEKEKTFEFVLDEPVKSLHVMAPPWSNPAALRVELHKDDRLLCDVGISPELLEHNYGHFQVGRDLKPGRCLLVLSQEGGGAGGKILISSRHLGMTGWQIYSRAVLGIVALSSVWMIFARNARTVRQRLASRVVFHHLLLAILLVVLYLFLHEGGHALAASLFGDYDLASSDFFGIRGRPHAGSALGEKAEPWQRAVTAFAGPAMPTLAGWVLFTAWLSARVRRWRERRPLANLYFTAAVLMCVFPFIVVAVQLLGFGHDGDWRGFIQNVPGPLFAVKGAVWFAWVVNLAVIVRVGVELRRAWKAYLAAQTSAVLENMAAKPVQNEGVRVSR